MRWRAPILYRRRSSTGFFLKLNVTYPSIQQLEDIVDRTTQHDPTTLQNILDAERVGEMKEFVRTIPVAAHVKNYAARLVLATHPDSPYATDLAKHYVLNMDRAPVAHRAWCWAAK